MELSFEELVKAVNGEIVADNNYHNFNNVSIDTRKIDKENVYIALNGENFNGNKFVIEALKKGASIAIADEVLFDKSEAEKLGVVIKVEDTYKALTELAKYYRNKLNIKIVAVTGSTGKTSTKDLIAAFLSEKYKVLKTKGNFNNHIGMPLMILTLDSSYDVAVLEHGMSDFNEIHNLVECSRPDIAVITNIGISHIENLKTQENIFKAKMEVVDFFDKNNTLIVNAEDKFLNTVKSDRFKVIKTGYNNNLDFVAENVEALAQKTIFTIAGNGKQYKFTLPMSGKHNVLNALLAIAAAKELDVTYEEMIAGIKNIENTSMRLEFIKKEDITIINDCYNASPDSMKSALDVLKNSEGNRKVAILGTMRELGDESNSAHTFVGAYAKDKADFLIAIGEYSEFYKSGFGNNNIMVYNNKEEMINDLDKIIVKGDVVLVKASRTLKFEEIVSELSKISF